MKVLIINGSPRENGNTKTILNEAIKEFEKENVEYDLYDIGKKAIRGCMACGYCFNHDSCAINDDVNMLAKKLDEADGVIIASPVYYASPNGSLIALLDRLFYSSKCNKRFKVGASFAIARRGGTVATFDVLNKYFTINQMPIASGKYWNISFGRKEGESINDEEGLQNARIVARNMIFLMKAIKDAKEKYGLPEDENKIMTSFFK